MTACASFINCDNKNLTWEALVKMLAQVSSEGCVAANTVSAIPSDEESNMQLRPDGDRQFRPDSTIKLRPD